MSKPINVEDINSVIADFWRENSLNEHFPEVFIFGSSINRGGRHFVPAGTMGSDIDLLAVINPDHKNAEGRFEALTFLASNMKLLEGALAELLERKEKILSVLPVTDYEVYHCIHKGHDPKLFTLNLFHDVLKNMPEKDGLSDFIDFDFHLENIEQFSVMKTCQSFRNKYVAIDLIGIRNMENFDGPGEVPKELMRAFALLTYVDSQNPKDGERTDLEHGFRAMKEVLHGLSGTAEKYKRICDKVEARSFLRAKSEPLTPEDQLILYEIAFDEAKRRVRKSVREVIDGMQ